MVAVFLTAASIVAEPSAASAASLAWSSAASSAEMPRTTAVSFPAVPASLRAAAADEADDQLVDVDVADLGRARPLHREREAEALDAVDRERAGAVQPGILRSCVPTLTSTGPAFAPG